MFWKTKRCAILGCENPAHLSLPVDIVKRFSSTVFTITFGAARVGGGEPETCPQRGVEAAAHLYSKPQTQNQYFWKRAETEGFIACYNSRSVWYFEQKLQRHVLYISETYNILLK